MVEGRGLALLICLLSVPCVASNALPRAYVSGNAVCVQVSRQKLSVSLADAVLDLRTPYGSWKFTGMFQHSDGWATPSRAPARPEIRHSKDGVQVRVVYPLVDERRVILALTAYRDIRAFFITSKLERLRHPAGEYYFWQSNANFDHYYCPGASGTERKAADVGIWDSIDHEEWLFFPAGNRGGLAVLPTNACGRSPGRTGCLYLHALPKSDVLEPGQFLQAGFGLAGVREAKEAASLWAKARNRRIPALQLGIKGSADYGIPAPKWLREAETYNLYYHPAAEWTDQTVREKLRHFPFVIGSTPDKAALERCHKAGVRLLAYVVYTCLLDTEMQKREGGTVYSEWLESVDHESRDLKDHPDWVCIDKDGNVQHDAWGLANRHPGLLNTCLHQPDLQEAALRQVRMLMEMGFDGIFIDLAGPTVECYGPKFGKHSHPDGKQTNTEAYEELLRKIYRTVKSYGDDRIVIQNTCVSVMPGHWTYCDAQMREAFPFGSEHGNLLANWQEMRWFGAANREAGQRGKVPVILSYLGKAPAERIRESALFSYAYARIYGLLWADGLTLVDRPDAAAFARELYGVRLGKPVGATKTADGALYRQLEKGLVVLNPAASRASVSIPVSRRSALTDIGYGRKLKPVKGRLRLDLAPESGRVLVWQTAGLACRGRK